MFNFIFFLYKNIFYFYNKNMKQKMTFRNVKTCQKRLKIS